MPDELEPTTPQAGDPVAEGQEPNAQEEKDVAKLRAEAAKWRTQFRDAQKQIETLKPQAEQFQKLEESQKTEAQKLADQIAALTAQVAEKDAAAQAAQRQAKLTVLATKANVDSELIPLIDISKLDLDNETETLKTLGKLATAKAVGSASNPERSAALGKSDDELRKEIFGGRQKSSLFGG